jgi:hypothetical protein
MGRVAGGSTHTQLCLLRQVERPKMISVFEGGLRVSAVRVCLAPAPARISPTEGKGRAVVAFNGSNTLAVLLLRGIFSTDYAAQVQHGCLDESLIHAW